MDTASEANIERDAGAGPEAAWPASPRRRWRLLSTLSARARRRAPHTRDVALQSPAHSLSSTSLSSLSSPPRTSCSSAVCGRPSTWSPGSSECSDLPVLPHNATSTSTKRYHLFDLPDELLQAVAIRAVHQHPAQTWTTPVDLASPTAQALIHTHPRLQRVFYAAILRFSFFLVRTSAPTQRAATTHALILRGALRKCTSLRELQLFVRPRDLYAVDAVASFFAHTVAPVSTVHLCFAPPPQHQPNDPSWALASYSGDHTPTVVATNIIRAIATRGPRLRALSLDCCNALTQDAVDVLADSVGPALQRLALDGSHFPDWSHLTRFPGLVELRLQNVDVNNSSLQYALHRLRKLEILALHQLPVISADGLRPLVDVQNLHTLELSRCIGIDDDAIAFLPTILTLKTLRLVHIDVTAPALNALVTQMGPRLLSLSVNAISVAHDSHSSLLDAPPSSNVLKTLMDAVQTHCTNVQFVDFGNSPASLRSHWSVRPYAEALRNPTPPFAGTTYSAHRDDLQPEPRLPRRGLYCRARARREPARRPTGCFA